MFYIMEYRINKIRVVKFFTLIFLTWIYQYYSDEGTFSKHIEKENKLYIPNSIIAQRRLAMYQNINELSNARLDNNLYNGDYYVLVKVIENNPTFEQLKQCKLNNMGAYLRSYKNRYSRKKGLKKFDCYYKKKLFSRIDKIEKLAQQKNITKKRIKKIIYKKYGIRFILLSLLPLFGLILPIKYYNTDHIKKNCIRVINGKTNKVIKYLHKDCEILPPEYRLYNYLFFTSLGLIIILFIIYTYVKILKYKRIKSGMQK